MTLDAGHFRERYAASADPYRLAERWYEARRYALTAARSDGDLQSVAQAGGIA